MRCTKTAKNLSSWSTSRHVGTPTKPEAPLERAWRPVVHVPLAASAPPYLWLHHPSSVAEPPVHSERNPGQLESAQAAVKASQRLVHVSS